MSVDRAAALREWAERNGYGTPAAVEAPEPAPTPEPEPQVEVEPEAAALVLTLPETWAVHEGDCIALMRALPDACVDAVVTDPPYEIGFMGKTWDSTGVAYSTETWAECLRVLKPGGHLLAFAAARTYHRIAVAIEDAGFEIRDMVEWIYGTGFPKSLDVSKAIDKAAGAEREVVGQHPNPAGNKAGGASLHMSERGMPETAVLTAPATPDAQKWSGWGTALKPAHEPIVLARKPLESTVARNVLEHGTGALNIGATRVGTEGGTSRGDTSENRLSAQGAFTTGHDVVPLDAGRWPANLILGPDAAADLDESTTEASRFFYVAKPSRRERDAGLGDDFKEGRAGPQRANQNLPLVTKPRKNTHPTVKPAALMRYLCRLVTPPGGLVLDPFAGSGSTGMGAVSEGFRFLGLELEADHVAIARARIEHATKEDA